MGFFPARSEGSRHEMHLVTTSEGDEIVVDTYAGQETVVARGVSYTLPSRQRAMLWVNHGLDIDVVLPIVRRLLGFEPDTPFHWDIRAHGRRAQSTHRLGYHISVRRASALDKSKSQVKRRRYEHDGAVRWAKRGADRRSAAAPGQSFERGWFWTTTAVCHGGKSDGLAFRQRPDGNGIEIRCHTGGCSAGVVITELEVAHWAAHLDGLRAGE